MADSDIPIRRLGDKFHLQVIHGKIEIVKTSNNEVIPLVEPVFLLRARDWLAAKLLAHYRQLCVEDNCTEYQLHGTDLAISRFLSFQKLFPKRMKQPGVTRGL